MTFDVLASVAALLITVMILSYLIGDSPFFRIAVNVFVGVAAGYVAAVAWWQVLWPKLLVPLLAGQGSSRTVLAVPLVLVGLLLMKAWPPFSRLGAPALGLLVGVASAVAIGGAIQGTLWPQLGATLNGVDTRQAGSFDGMINGGFILLGLITSLVYFQFSASASKDGSVGRPWLLSAVSAVGAVFIAIALGTLFAGAYSAALTALIERLHFMGTFLGLG